MMKPLAVAAVSTVALMFALAPASAHAQSRASFSLHFGAPIAAGGVYYGSTFYGSSFYGRPYWSGPRYWHPYGPAFYGPPSVFLAPPPVFYSSPSVIAVPTQPPVYIEKPRSAAPAAPSAHASQAHQGPNTHWYYCSEAGAYYPYVKECAGRWQPVPAQPAPR